MEISRISSKGQVTIPVSVRNKLHLTAGENVVFFEENGRFYIENASAISLKYIGPENDFNNKYDFTKNEELEVSQPGIRYCTIKKSLDDSLKEVKEIKEGKKEAMTLDDLFENINKWVDEEDA